MEVGRRAERAEAEFWAGYARNVTLTDENRFTGAIPVAGGFAICFQGTKNDYGLGVGSTRALRADDLRIVDEFYWARGLPSSLEVHPDVLERDGALLTSWGYRPVETVAVLEVDLGALPTAAPGITIEPMSGRRAEWIELVTSGFDDVSDAQALRHAIHISAAAATELVGARIGGRLAGGGALGMVRDGALLYSGSVLPAMRRRGVYGALVRARLASAVNRGATFAFMKARAESASMHAALALGFTRIYDRTRLVKLA